VQEAEFFVGALSDRDLHLGALVLNKVLPTYLRSTAATKVARSFTADADPLADQVLAGLGDIGAHDDVARVLREVGESFLNYQVVAKREAELRDELSTVPDVVATVPYFDSDIFDLAGLLALGGAIWR
jgi:hypothetical protein